MDRGAWRAIVHGVARVRDDLATKQHHVVTLLPWCLSGKKSACQCRRHKLDPLVGKISWRRREMATPCSFLAWEIP